MRVRVLHDRLRARRAPRPGPRPDAVWLVQSGLQPASARAPLDVAVAQLRDHVRQLRQEPQARVDGRAAEPRDRSAWRRGTPPRRTRTGVPARGRSSRSTGSSSKKNCPVKRLPTRSPPTTIGVAASHMPFLHRYSLASPTGMSAVSTVSLSMQYAHVSGFTRWKRVHTSCQPAPTITFPSQVDQRHRDVRELVEVVHHRLQRRRVDEVGELQVRYVASEVRDIVVHAVSIHHVAPRARSTRCTGRSPSARAPGAAHTCRRGENGSRKTRRQNYNE